jgi:hypothetical protein
MRHDHADRIASRWMSEAPGTAEGDEERRRARRRHATDALARLLPGGEEDASPPFVAVPITGDRADPQNGYRWLSHECLVLAEERTLYLVGGQERDPAAETADEPLTDLIVFVGRVPLDDLERVEVTDARVPEGGVHHRVRHWSFAPALGTGLVIREQTLVGDESETPEGRFAHELARRLGWDVSGP